MQKEKENRFWEEGVGVAMGGNAVRFVKASPVCNDIHRAIVPIPRNPLNRPRRSR